MNVTITPPPPWALVPTAATQIGRPSTGDHHLPLSGDGVCPLLQCGAPQDIRPPCDVYFSPMDADISPTAPVIRGADLVDGFETPPEIMDCGESGSTLRFLIPVALALKGGGRFTGHGRLMERPQEPYFRLFTEKGIAWSLENGVLAVEGRLTPGVYALPGDVSSQFITGLLYALPLLEGDSELVLTTALESRGYVDMTLDALAQFGVSAEYDGDRRFRVPGNQAYRHRDLAIEGDWSNAAFWFAAAFLGHRVDVEGLNPLRPGRPGDRGAACPPDPARPGGAGRVPVPRSGAPSGGHGRPAGGGDDRHRQRRPPAHQGERPAGLCDAGAQRPGGRCGGARRPPGAPGQGAAGGGRHCLRPQRPPHRHDGRHCGHPLSGRVTITGAECVNKSYPRFWADYEALGGQIART